MQGRGRVYKHTLRLMDEMFSLSRDRVPPLGLGKVTLKPSRTMSQYQDRHGADPSAIIVYRKSIATTGHEKTRQC